MGVFAAFIALGCLALAAPLAVAFRSNAWFNTVILAVLAVGAVITVRQVVLLYREIAWVEAWRAGDRVDMEEARPVLLASVAQMLAGRGDASLSATSMRTLLDSIRTRLEESRDLSRYFIGLLIFLGLLGTFWGLMATVGSVATVIGGMTVEGSDGAQIFENLKENLAGPLAGMGVAFSSSLFGLAGSLVLGFLDLQASHAQNRFVNELEEWLSGSTRLSSGALGDEAGIAGAPAYVEALLEKTADALEKMQRSAAADETTRERTGAELGRLGEALDRLGRQLREQNESVERLAETQAALAREVDRLGGEGLGEELRAELRLLSKTVANALAQRD